MENPEGKIPLTHLEHLVVTAFQAARTSGKEDWRTMKLAVLKNRLLQVSNRAFRESNYGAGSFRELLLRLPDVIQVEGDIVELRPSTIPTRPDGHEDANHQPKSVEQQRVRHDLWLSIIDYSSGKSYVWDVDNQRVREKAPGDQLVLPTLSRQEMAEWRRQFSEQHQRPTDLAKWQDEELGVQALPESLRGPWNGFLKKKVAERLSEWFVRHEIPDATFSQDTQQSLRSKARLRSLVLACVNVMTEGELSELKLSPTVVLRALEKGFTL